MDTHLELGVESIDVSLLVPYRDALHSLSRHGKSLIEDQPHRSLTNGSSQLFLWRTCGWTICAKPSRMREGRLVDVCRFPPEWSVANKKLAAEEKKAAAKKKSSRKKEDSGSKKEIEPDWNRYFKFIAKCRCQAIYSIAFVIPFQGRVIICQVDEVREDRVV